jgi:hypothetical protein
MLLARGFEGVELFARALYPVRVAARASASELRSALSEHFAGLVAELGPKRFGSFDILVMHASNLLVSSTIGIADFLTDAGQDRCCRKTNEGANADKRKQLHRMNSMASMNARIIGRKISRNS